MRDLTHCESRIESPVTLGDDHPFEPLQTLTVALTDPDLNIDRITLPKFRQVLLKLGTLDLRYDVFAHGLFLIVTAGHLPDIRPAIFSRLHPDPSSQ